ncbi:MAG: hypothetical protein ACOH2T_19290 [Pseudomonas sp.]
MFNHDEIQYAEVTLEEAKKTVALAESVRRLGKNADFKKVIINGYFKDEAARLVMLLAERMPAEDKQTIQDSIEGIGQLYQYLLGVEQMGLQALKSIEDHEEELALLRAEETDSDE